MYEYNSEEVNIEKIIGDFAPQPIEVKRSHSRAGCDCQLSVSVRFSLKLKKIFFFFSKLRMNLERA